MDAEADDLGSTGARTSQRLLHDLYRIRSEKRALTDEVESARAMFEVDRADDTLRTSAIPVGWQIRINVTHAEVVQRRFVAYKVRVSYGASAVLSADGATQKLRNEQRELYTSSWEVTRRFSHFYRLHVHMRREFLVAYGAEAQFPKLPRKRLNLRTKSKFSEEFVEERRVSLELYLRQVLLLFTGAAQRNRIGSGSSTSSVRGDDDELVAGGGDSKETPSGSVKPLLDLGDAAVSAPVFAPTLSSASLAASTDAPQPPPRSSSLSIPDLLDDFLEFSENVILAAAKRHKQRREESEASQSAADEEIVTVENTTDSRADIVVGQLEQCARRVSDVSVFEDDESDGAISSDEIDSTGGTEEGSGISDGNDTTGTTSGRVRGSLLADYRRRRAAKRADKAAAAQESGGVEQTAAAKRLEGALNETVLWLQNEKQTTISELEDVKEALAAEDRVQDFLAEQFKALQAKLDEVERKDAGSLERRIQLGEAHASRIERLMKEKRLLIQEIKHIKRARIDLAQETTERKAAYLKLRAEWLRLGGSAAPDDKQRDFAGIAGSAAGATARLRAVLEEMRDASAAAHQRTDGATGSRAEGRLCWLAPESAQFAGSRLKAIDVKAVVMDARSAVSRVIGDNTGTCATTESLDPPPQEPGSNDGASAYEVAYEWCCGLIEQQEKLRLQLIDASTRCPKARETLVGGND